MIPSSASVRKHRQHGHESGFTLIEMLVVVVLIALVASLVAPRMFSKLDSSQVKAAKAQMAMIETALDAFRLDVGRYPTESEGLEVLWDEPEGIPDWDGPYLPKPVKSDPWGQPYIYSQPGENGKKYDLRSLGADGKTGGEGVNADFSVWD